MTRRILLYPNVGAEEGPRNPGATEDLFTLPLLWSLLFPADAELQETEAVRARRAAEGSPDRGRFPRAGAPVSADVLSLQPEPGAGNRGTGQQGAGQQGPAGPGAADQGPGELGASDRRAPNRDAADRAGASAPALAGRVRGGAPGGSRPLLGSPFDAPAFPGFEALEGLVPWFPDPAAADLARRLRLPLASPDPAIVARVHDKAFAIRVARSRRLLPDPLGDLIEILDPDQLVALDAAGQIERRVAAWPAPYRRSFTLKPRKGTSGRGRVAGRKGKLGTDASGALRRLAGRGGAILEPWLARTRDLSAQLWIAPDGSVTLLGTTEQILTASGIYRGNRGVISTASGPASGSPADAELRAAAMKLAGAAAAEGFWGACGVDAFLFADPERGETLRPVVELNARFTTGTVALGLLRRAQESGLLEGWGAWCFAFRLPAGTAADPAGSSPCLRVDLSLSGRAAGGAALLLGPSLEDLERWMTRAGKAPGTPPPHSCRPYVGKKNACPRGSSS